MAKEEYRRAAEQSAPPKPQRPRPIVILGAGGIVRAAHLPAYGKAGFPVLGIADSVPGKAAALAAEFGAGKGFNSVEQAVRTAPADAVFDIAVPASQILAILPLLPKGAAVLIQKPMGETLEEARSIRDICRERELIAAVNFQLRYAPNNLGAVSLAKAGVLGELHDMEVQVRTYTPWHLWTFLAQAPRLEILYHSIHYLDLVRSWLGEPLGVYAETVRNPNPASAALAATKTSMILDYGEWKRVVVVTNHGHDFAETQCSFVQWEGTNGAIRMEMGVNLDYPVGKPDTLSYALRSEGGWTSVPMRGSWFPDAFVGSMGALQAYVEGSVTELPIGFESAYKTMALVEAAYRSGERGGEVPPA